MLENIIVFIALGFSIIAIIIIYKTASYVFNRVWKSENDDWPKGPALKYKMPVGTLACPHCGAVVTGAIDEPICGICDSLYWDEEKKEASLTTIMPHYKRDEIEYALNFMVRNEIIDSMSIELVSVDKLSNFFISLKITIKGKSKKVIDSILSNLKEECKLELRKGWYRDN